MRASPAIEFVLSVLQQGTEATVDLFNMIGMSPKEAARTLHRRPEGFSFATDWATTYRDRQKFHNLLQHLKRQGLVTIERQTKGSLWHITTKGRDMLKTIRGRNLFSQAAARYDAVPDTTLKIVIYDIPTTRDSARQHAWLRSALRNMDFTPLQRSVWVGKKKIHEKFMRDLRERHLLPAVQIFAISTSGTLREVS